jgi:hypothetical protein
MTFNILLEEHISLISPVTYQSPGVNTKDPKFMYVLVVIATLFAADDNSSPTLPAFAVFPDVVPTMPFVVDGVIAPVNVQPVV